MIEFLFTLVDFGRAIKNALKDKEFRSLLIVVVVILFTGTMFYSNVEGWSYVDSLYFSVITLTTVGNGGFFPVTDIGKIFTILYIFVGLGVILGFISIISLKVQKQNFLSRFMTDRKTRNDIRKKMNNARKRARL